MLDDAEACRARALRCFEIAEKAPTLEDRLEFIKFSESWEALANEIQRSELLISLLDQLIRKNVRKENAQGELEECEQSGIRPLRRLATGSRMMFGHLIFLPILRRRDVYAGDPDRAVVEVKHGVNDVLRERQDLPKAPRVVSDRTCPTQVPVILPEIICGGQIAKIWKAVLQCQPKASSVYRWSTMKSS